LSAHWIEFGHGPKSLNETPNAVYSAIGNYKIPLISEEQALDWSPKMSAKEVPVETYLHSDEPVTVHQFALTVRGDSMEPRFYDGDQIVIDTKLQPQPGEFVLAKTDKVELLFRKYRPRSTGTDGTLIFELMPLNDDYPSVRSDVVGMTIIGTMIEARSKRRR
jgi:SOS-response transcriptional repressor LexA